MPEVPQKFTAQAAMDAEQGKKMDTQEWQFEPPEFIEEAVDIKVSACGVCGSCIHTITSGWGPSKYPCVVGHEIVGTVVRAGKNQPHKVGDRVGFGAQSGSCGECEMCKAGHENVCMGSKSIPGMIGTYQGSWPKGKDYTKGGYADYFRGFGHFAVPIPKELSDEVAAPMLCGGVTTYTPLVQHGAGPGKKVGIVGIGGLGHFGLMWSNALGADTYAISHSHSKEADVEKMGIPKDHFIATSDNHEEVLKKYKSFFDILIVTANHHPPISDLYIPMMRPYGSITFVGLSEEALPRIKPQLLTGKSISICGSIIGSPQQIKDMLALAVKHNIKTWAEVRPMKEVGQALKDLDAGKARYRYVMVN